MKVCTSYLCIRYRTYNLKKKIPPLPPYISIHPQFTSNPCMKMYKSYAYLCTDNTIIKHKVQIKLIIVRHLWANWIFKVSGWSSLSTLSPKVRQLSWPQQRNGAFVSSNLLNSTYCRLVYWRIQQAKKLTILYQTCIVDIHRPREVW
jgi:hypothetical protein